MHGNFFHPRKDCSVMSCGTVLLCIFLFPAAALLPQEYFFENNYVENLQAVLLGIAFFISIWQVRISLRSECKHFWRGASALWFIAFWRELSWGRVFYSVGMNESGPKFVGIHDLWYGEVVYPLLAAALLYMFYQFYKARKYVSASLNGIDRAHLVLFFIMLSFSQLVFEKGVITALAPYSQPLEEMAELIAYWSAAVMQAVFIATQNSKYKQE